MKKIPQRELRNDNADVIRRVEEGASFTITRHGHPVAVLAPYQPLDDLPCAKPAVKRITKQNTRPVESTQRTADVLNDLRGDR